MKDRRLFWNLKQGCSQPALSDALTGVSPSASSSLPEETSPFFIPVLPIPDEYDALYHAYAQMTSSVFMGIRTK
jgi:hypothetical protein